MTYPGPLRSDVTAADYDLILRIADRADAMYKKFVDKPRDRPKKLTTIMDLICVHGRCRKLKLADLLASDDFNFSHDVGGIHRHLDREAGVLRDCFLPRFSAREEASA